MEPTRQDLSMMSGSKKTFEFAFQSNNGPRDITSETIDVYVASGYGKAWQYKYSSLPGDHYDSTGGLVRLEFEFPSMRTTQTWWYEAWIRETKENHIVGELQLIGSVRT